VKRYTDEQKMEAFEIVLECAADAMHDMRDAEIAISSLLPATSAVDHKLRDKLLSQLDFIVAGAEMAMATMDDMGVDGRFFRNELRVIIDRAKDIKNEVQFD
jgi:hypothetical protein